MQTQQLHCSSSCSLLKTSFCSSASMQQVACLIVATSRNHGSQPVLTAVQARVTAQYGSAAYCDQGLQALLSVCGVQVGTGNGPVQVALPQAVSISSFTAVPGQITRSVICQTGCCRNSPFMPAWGTTAHVSGRMFGAF